MDYAIYKTTDGKNPRIIHRFRQEDCNHRAKLAAWTKLNEMWQHILQRPLIHKNPQGTKDDFQYDHMTSVQTSEHIRFYIAKF